MYEFDPIFLSSFSSSLRKSYKFDKDDYRKDLEKEVKNIGWNSYKDFKTAFSRVLEKHAPEKKKYLRANNNLYVSNAIRVATIKRSELSGRYRKYTSGANSIAFYVNFSRL